jgi:hypothetical protein
LPAASVSAVMSAAALASDPAAVAPALALAEVARVPVAQAQERAALAQVLAMAELARAPEEKATVAPAVVTPIDSPCKYVRRRSQHQRARQRCWARRPLQWFRWRCRCVLTQS